MSKHLRASLTSSLTVALLLPLFVYLGYWQLQRADEKRQLQEEYDTRASDAVVKIEPRVQRAEDLRFYRVTVKGHYETDYQILVDNRVHHGVAGYYVVTPLHIEGGKVRVLVNRGWIPLGESREHLPRIDTPEGPQVVDGIAAVPATHFFRLAEEAPMSDDGQTVWQHLDLKRYAASVPFPLQPVVILLDSASPAGGFTREWRRLDTGIVVHQGYAFQWFALAAALLMIYLLLGRRAARSARSDAN